MSKWLIWRLFTLLYAPGSLHTDHGSVGRRPDISALREMR